jgi:hypothetical protein
MFLEDQHLYLRSKQVAEQIACLVFFLMLGSYSHDQARIGIRRQTAGGARQGQFAIGQGEHPFRPHTRIARGFSRTGKKQGSVHGNAYAEKFPERDVRMVKAALGKMPKPVNRR